MDFSEPEEATQLKDELSTFIEDEIEPLEEEHARFLGPDAERHIFDDSFEQVPEYLELKETIRKRAAEAGFWGMNMPEEVGGRGSTRLPTRSSPSFSRTVPGSAHVRRSGRRRRPDADPAGLRRTTA